MKLSENFSLSEFTRSETAEKYNIDNVPTDTQIQALRALCQNMLQPIHDAIGRLLGHDDYYIKIQSGLRVDKLNEIVGGSSTSFHLYGFAADCELYIKGKECNALLYHVAKELFKVTEIIWEYDTVGADKPHLNQPKWVHIAYAGGDSRNMIKYIS